MGQFAVILAAAGRSTRFGDPKQKKIYAELEGRAVWLRALDPFLTHGEVEQIIVAIAPEDRELFERRYHDKAAFLNLDVIDGGAERSDTVARALERVRPICQFVAIHDAARPCLTEVMVSAVFSAALEHGACLAGDSGQRHDQAHRRRPFHHRDGSPAQPLPGPNSPGLSPRLAGKSLCPALPGRRRRHGRYPACRGSRAPLRHRARVHAAISSSRRRRTSSSPGPSCACNRAAHERLPVIHSPTRRCSGPTCPS